MLVISRRGTVRGGVPWRSMVGPIIRPVETSTTTISPGPSRRRCVTRSAASSTLPASDETTTSPSSVAVSARGRSPLRSSIAPTRRPSPNTSAAGPSHGSDRAWAGSSAGPPSPSAAGISEPMAASIRIPPSSNSSSASSSDCESEPTSVTSGPISASRFAHRLLPSAWRRPRIASRFERTVLISPLCAR